MTVDTDGNRDIGVLFAPLAELPVGLTFSSEWCSTSALSLLV